MVSEPGSVTLWGLNSPAAVAVGAWVAVDGLKMVVVPSSSVSVKVVDAPAPATARVVPDRAVSSSSGA